MKLRVTLGRQHYKFIFNLQVIYRTFDEVELHVLLPSSTLIKSLAYSWIKVHHQCLNVSEKNGDGNEEALLLDMNGIKSLWSKFFNQKPRKIFSILFYDAKEFSGFVGYCFKLTCMWVFMFIKILKGAVKSAIHTFTYHIHLQNHIKIKIYRHAYLLLYRRLLVRLLLLTYWLPLRLLVLLLFIINRFGRGFKRWRPDDGSLAFGREKEIILS